VSPYCLSEEFAGIAGQRRAAVTLRDEVAQLFVEAREDVYRYLLIVGLHPGEAQEAAQEVFLRLYAALKKGEDIHNRRAWIFRVAHNLGLKILAQQKARVPFDLELEGRMPDGAANPERALLDRERAARIQSAIEGLSDRQRRCLHLRLEGLRYPEIGEALGISPSAVGEFLRRAIVRLKKVLP